MLFNCWEKVWSDRQCCGLMLAGGYGFCRGRRKIYVVGETYRQCEKSEIRLALGLDFHKGEVGFIYCWFKNFNVDMTVEM